VGRGALPAGQNRRHPFSEAKTLVVRGPYRWTRNPMYLGMAAILLGFALYLGSVTPFIVIPAFMGLIAERFIVPEEEMLEKTFGQAYSDYKARVRRWL
jgi:protein-S-isoprenylcysteine O-methyltransferase Ste14